jgi:hypothetical protein
MPVDRTFGYDLVLELSDAAVSELITPLESYRQEPFDQYVSVPPFGPYHVTADLVEIMPTSTAVEFVPHVMTNGVRAVVDFDLNVNNHNLADLFPGIPILEDDIGLIGAELRVTHPIGVFTDGSGNSCLGMDFSSGIPLDRIEVDLAAALGTDATPVVEAIAAILVQILLQDHIGYLGTAVPFPIVPGDTEPWTLESCEVRVVTEHCLAILFMTMPGRAVNPDAYTACNLRRGENAICLTSNRWLLQDLACPAVAEYFGMAGDVSSLFTYNESDVESELNNPQSANHLFNRGLLDYVPVEALHGLSADTVYDTLDWLIDDVSLRRLRLYVAPGYLGMDGQLRATGVRAFRSDGVSATIDFEARATVRMTDAGDIEIIPDVRRTSVNIRVEWWVFLPLAFAVLFSPTVLIATVCLAPLVSRLADYIVTAIANALRGLEIGLEDPVTFDIPPLPIEIDRIVLDDLTYGGRVVVPERPAPRAPSAWIVGEMEVDEATPTGVDFIPISGVVHGERFSQNLSHVGRFRVETHDMRNPLTCRWTLVDDQSLTGTDSVVINGTSVEYTVDGRHCELRVGEGDSLDAELCVHVTDARGVQDSDCVRVEAEGSVSSTMWVGAELLEGPSVLEYLYWWEAASAIATAIPPDDHPDWGAVCTVLDTALAVGMNFELGRDSWIQPGPEPWIPHWK